MLHPKQGGGTPHINTKNFYFGVPQWLDIHLFNNKCLFIPLDLSSASPSGKKRLLFYPCYGHITMAVLTKLRTFMNI